MNSITLNLAGDELNLLYSDDFAVLKCEAQQGWITISDQTKIELGCGVVLNKQSLLLTIKHKLGII